MPVVRRWPKVWRATGVGTAVCIAAGSSDVRHLPTTDRRVRSAIAGALGEFREYYSSPTDRRGTQEKADKTSQECLAIRAPQRTAAHHGSRSDADRRYRRDGSPDFDQ